jgi:hypothetical protein
MTTETYIDELGRFTIEKDSYLHEWKFTITGEEFRSALDYDSYIHKEDLSLKQGFKVPTDEFDKCMKKYGFERYDNKEYPISDLYNTRGYAIFPGDEDKEMWVKMMFTNFSSHKEGGNIIQVTPYHEEDGEYNDALLETYWNIIGVGLHDAIVAFLKDEDCSGERAKEAALEKERQIMQAKENAILLEYQAKKNLSRRLKEDRQKKLKSLHNAYINAYIKTNLPENNNYYKSNDEYVSPDLTKSQLFSRIENAPVSHTFIVAVKNDAYASAANDDERIRYTDLNELVLLPAWKLSIAKFLCKGMVESDYVKDSIIRSDITVALIEPTAEKDDSYFAGLATLLVKEDAVEIDVICSQIGYKMAGKLLMNKVIEIATKLGKSKIELLSVKIPETVAFYKRFLFKKVGPNNNFSKKETSNLIALRRRITRKIAGSNKNKPADGESAAGGAGIGGRRKTRRRRNTRRKSVRSARKILL